jgi:hypothetical protein
LAGKVCAAPTGISAAAGNAEFIGAKRPGNTVEHAVHQSRLGAAIKCAGNPDILSQQDRGGHLVIAQQFPGSGDQDDTQQQFKPLPLQRRAHRRFDQRVDMPLFGIGATNNGAQQRDVGGNEDFAIDLMTDPKLDKASERLGGGLSGLRNLIEDLHRGQTGGAAPGLGRGPRLGRRLRTLADEDGQRRSNSRRSAIIARQARAVSPPLSISPGLARTQACSSSSTVSTPKPIARPWSTARF